MMMRLFLAFFLTVLLAVGSLRLATAGTVGDSFVGIGQWISKVEKSISDWAAGWWQQLDSGIGTDEQVALFRRMVLERPAQISELAAKTGFELEEYGVSRGDDRELTMYFRYERQVSDEERFSLMRDVLSRTTAMGAPEIELLRILLDASDWQEAGQRTNFELRGVDVTLSDELRSRLVYKRILVKG